MLVVDKIGAGVGDGESEGFGGCGRGDSGVDEVEFLGVAGPDLVEDIEEIGVGGLAVDGFEFDDVYAHVFDNLGIEEEWAVVMVGEEFTLGRGSDDGFELPDVAEGDDRDPAKRVFRLAVFAEGDADGVEEVGPDH